MPQEYECELKEQSSDQNQIMEQKRNRRQSDQLAEVS